MPTLHRSSFIQRLGLCLLALCGFAGSAYAQELDSLSLESLLEQRVSTAAKYEQTMAEAPASVTIVTAEQIAQHGYTSLSEVLASVRGFFMTDDHVRDYIGTRGYGRMVDFNNRVIVLVNGHRLNERIYGVVTVGQEFPIDMQAVERIEVVRGPGSALYGTGAMFGVINVVTKAPPYSDGVRISGDVGSYGELRSSMALSLETTGGWRVFATSSVFDAAGRDLYYAEFDDPETNDGWAEGLNWSRAYSGYLSAQYDEWTVQALVSHADTGVPNGELQSAFNTPGGHYARSRGFLEVKRSTPRGLTGHVDVRGFVDFSDVNLAYPITIRRPEAGMDSVGLDAGLGGRIHTVGGEGVLRWDLRPDNRLVLGVQAITNYYLRFATQRRLAEGSRFSAPLSARIFESYLDETHFDEIFPYNSFALYVQDEIQFSPKLVATIGLRGEIYDGRGVTSPRGAIVYHPWAVTTFKVLYGGAYRQPGITERHLVDPVFGIEAGGELRPERIRTAELVWEQHLGPHWVATASAFDYKVSDLIATEATSEWTGRFTNVHRVGARGVELELAGRLGRDLQTLASYSYQQARQIEPEADMENYPPHHAKGSAAYSGWRHATVAAQLFYESGRRTITNAWTDAYWLAHLNVTSRPFAERWRLTLGVRNLFGARYHLPAGAQHRPSDRFEQPGRRLLMRVSCDL